MEPLYTSAASIVTSSTLRDDFVMIEPPVDLYTFSVT